MLRLIAIGTLTIHMFLSSTVLTAQIATLQGDWPQFRGPLRDGVSADTGLLTKWPEGGPPLVWDTRGAGRGYASLSLVEGRIFTLGDGPSTAPDTDEYVSCFDRATGEQLWLKRLGPAWTSGRPDWQSSRSTPTIDGDLLYVLTAHGKLVCLKVDTGEPVWEKSLKDDFGGKKGDGWGYSESVLIDGDRLVCTPGGSAIHDRGAGQKDGRTDLDGSPGGRPGRRARFDRCQRSRRGPHLRTNHCRRGARRASGGRRIALVLPHRPHDSRHPKPDRPG